eukprot:15450377-Alexandrium_andersonii.AAC.1
MTASESAFEVLLTQLFASARLYSLELVMDAGRQLGPADLREWRLGDPLEAGSCVRQRPPLRQRGRAGTPRGEGWAHLWVRNYEFVATSRTP